MTEFLNNLFSTIFGDNVILATILISMIPIIELRGAIPFATNTGFWGVNSLSNWSAFGWSLLGSCLVVPIIALIFLPIMNLLKKTKLFHKLADWFENRVKSKSSNIENSEQSTTPFSKSYWKKMLGVFIFVAIPLPFTGVWTGTCIAVFLGLDFYSTCISVISGNIIAGLLITLIIQFFPWLNNYLFYIFIAIILLVLIFEIVKHFVLKKKESDSAKE